MQEELLLPLGVVTMILKIRKDWIVILSDYVPGSSMRISAEHDRKISRMPLSLLPLFFGIWIMKGTSGISSVN